MNPPAVAQIYHFSFFHYVSVLDTVKRLVSSRRRNESDLPDSAAGSRGHIPTESEERAETTTFLAWERLFKFVCTRQGVWEHWPSGITKEKERVPARVNISE
jgi:hypothetical protein